MISLVHKKFSSIFYVINIALVVKIVALTVFLSACKPDDDSSPATPITPFTSYIQVGNNFYSVKEAIVIYDQKGNETTFSLYFTHPEEDNSVLIDYLILPNTITLMEGKFDMKKIAHSSEMALHNYHVVDLKYGPQHAKTHVSSLQSPMNKSSLTVKKQNATYLIDATFEYNNQKAVVHFDGPIDYLAAW